MNARDLFYLVINNLKRMKARVVMTAMGVLIGSVAVILLVSLGLGLQRSFTQSLGEIGDLTLLEVRQSYDMGPVPSNRPQSDNQLDNETLDSFRLMPGVKAVTRKTYMQGAAMMRYQKYEGYGSFMGIEPSQLELLGFQMASGEARIAPGQVIVGAEVVRNFYNPRTYEMIDPTTIDLQDKNLELVLMRYPEPDPDSYDPYKPPEVEEQTLRLRVVGVMKKSGGQVDYSVFMPIKEVEKYNLWATFGVPSKDPWSNSVWVKTTNPSTALDVEKAITEMGYMVDSPRQFIESMNRFFLIVQAVLGGIGAVALLVAAVGIANTMIMAIYERTQEIGLMKSLGARNADVMLVFLAEAGGIGLLGGIGGVLVSLALAALGNSIGGPLLAGSGFFPMPSDGSMNMTLLYMPVWLVVFALVFSILIGMASGVYPAIRAASLDPLNALRHE